MMAEAVFRLYCICGRPAARAIEAKRKEEHKFNLLYECEAGHRWFPRIRLGGARRLCK